MTFKFIVPGGMSPTSAEYPVRRYSAATTQQTRRSVALNRIMIVGAGALSTAAVALMTFGTGTAAAINEYAGQTYADAT